MNRLFIEEKATGKIRFTSWGKRQYRQKLAQLGIDIHQLKTREAAREAFQQYYNHKMMELGRKNRNAMIDEALLNIPAFAEGVKLRD